MKFISVNEALPQKNGIVYIRYKNCFDNVIECTALFDNGVFYRYGSPAEVKEWAYREVQKYDRV